MDKKLPILVTLLYASFIYCKEECKWVQTHTFEANADLILSFTAEIKNLDGLVIDIIYNGRKNDRIEISPKKNAIYEHNEEKYITKNISSFLNEGFHEMNISVRNNTLIIICKSSEMDPVIFNHQSGMKSIKVAAIKLKICEESCSPETSIEKIIGDDDAFNMSVFTTSKYPILFMISDSKESAEIVTLELKPEKCNLRRKHSSTNIPCSYIKPGWNRLNIFANRTVFAIANNIVLRADENWKTLSVSGSYLVNCRKGTPIWKISNQEEIQIPIIADQEIFFGLVSTVIFSPVFNLDGNNLSMTWNNGVKISSYGSPLKPNSYDIIFEATSDMLKLYNKNKFEKQLLMELKVDKVPEFIGVSSLSGNYSLTLSVQDPFRQTKEHDLVTGQPVMNFIPEDETTKSPSSNDTLITVVVLLILLSVILVVTILFIWKKMNDQKKENNQIKMTKEERKNYGPVPDKDTTDTFQEARNNDIETPTVIVHNTSYSTSSGSSNSIETQSSQDTRQSQDEEKARIESPKSILGDQEGTHSNLKIIDKQLKKIGKNKTVAQVLKELENVIDPVFKAIQNKRLYGENSADILLRDHGFPGTVRDNQGNSLLHYLNFLVQQDNETHRVNADDIKKFLGDHKVFANAVNYKGQTPLHALVFEASKGHSKNEWENMAQLLLDVGCDPRIHDNNGQLPEDIALYRGCIYLQTLLKKTRMNKGEITKKSKIDQWPTLLKGTKENDIESVRQLLLENVPILPFSSSSDPLREAIQRGNIELTMLLLSAGAPLCGRTLIGLNPLEVSHATPGLTIFLPSLIRREFYNCLRSESEMFLCNDSDQLQLKQAIIDLSETVRKDGYKNANWSFSSESLDRSERSKEARKMLRLAASSGMGLTCQMLGLEDVFLHPLPLEISADTDAKPNTLTILCRDLELSLSLKEGNIPSHLKEEYEEYNFKKLRDFCEKNNIIFSSLYDKQTLVNKKALKYIAEQGLDITYKKISKARNGQLVDLIVDPVTGFTMLHSAAYNGRMGMVEFLLLNNANERIKTDKGFTAAHVAAMRGHKECMEYILAFSKLSQSLTDDKTNSGLTSHQISDGYASEINNLSTFLLHENVSDSILSEPKFNKKAKLVLKEKKSTIKDCLSKGSLDFILPGGYINEHKNIWQQLKEESENFVKKLKDIDSRFSGKTINHHRNDDALELLLMDSYQIYLEVDNNEYWKEKNLHEAFMKSGYKALENYTVESRNLCLVPPVFKPTMIGANIFVSYCSQQITTHISIHVIPILKENLNLNTEDLQLSKMFNDTIAQTTVTHIAHTNSGERTYVTVDLEKQLFAKVDSSKLLVLSICRFIKKILYPHWWFPRIESRRHGRQWHHYAVSLQSVPDRLLISCFLWEIFNVPEEKWSNDDILERIIGVYEKMVTQDRHGRMIPSPNASCFLDPGKTVLKVWPTIAVIIDFLKELNM